MEKAVAHVTKEGSGKENSIGAFDSVVVAVGHRSHDPLSHALGDAGVSVTLIGDAARPRQIADATREGFTAFMG